MQQQVNANVQTLGLALLATSSDAQTIALVPACASPANVSATHSVSERTANTSIAPTIAQAMAIASMANVSVWAALVVTTASCKCIRPM
jgi:hypothetical protein